MERSIGRQRAMRLEWQGKGTMWNPARCALPQSVPGDTPLLLMA